MLNTLKTITETKDLPEDYEIRQLSGCRNKLSIVTLTVGTRLIVKDETEILIPKTLREEMMRILHLTRIEADKKENILAKHEQRFEEKYDECNTCAKHKTDKAQAHNEIS